MIFMFLTLKQHFSGHFACVEDVKCATTAWTYVLHIVVDKRNTCCDSCLNHQGDYVEKQYTIGTVIMYWQFPQLKSCL